MEVLSTWVALEWDSALGHLLQRDWESKSTSWHLLTHLATNPGSKIGQSHGPHVSPSSWSSGTQRSKRLCPTPQPKLSSWDTHHSQHFWLYMPRQSFLENSHDVKKFSPEYPSRSLEKYIILQVSASASKLLKNGGKGYIHWVHLFALKEFIWLWQGLLSSKYLLKRSQGMVSLLHSHDHICFLMNWYLTSVCAYV